MSTGPSAVPIARSPDDLRPFEGCAFVPTMGALHEGHAALLRRARASGLKVCLSIFVNPTQFGPNEDLARYPRTLESDLAIAAAEGVAVAYVPDLAGIYPEGIEAANRIAATLPLPDVATKPGLEDRCRPGHFAGVQLVVGRLFDAVRPRVAVFGEKDWQQLRLVQAMVRAEPDRWPGLEIIPHPTIREPDGLALSSRNRYLRSADREQARGVPRAIQIAHSAQRPSTAERLMRDTLEAHGFTVDYAVVRDAETLMPVDGFERPTRALIAARLAQPATTDGAAGSGVRLIDNAPMTIWR
jgi:pantoate--beta-alanine ligase